MFITATPAPEFFECVCVCVCRCVCVCVCVCVGGGGGSGPEFVKGVPVGVRVQARGNFHILRSKNKKPKPPKRPPWIHHWGKGFWGPLSETFS